MSFGVLFTAQPEAPAFMLAGVSGWAVNEGSGKARERVSLWLPNASPPRQAEWRQQVQLRTAELIRFLNRRFRTGNSGLAGHWLARHWYSRLAGLLTGLRLR